MQPMGAAMKCVACDGGVAIGLFTWGPYPHGDRNKDEPLCSRCSDELWERAKNPVAAGLLHFSIRPIPQAAGAADAG